MHTHENNWSAGLIPTLSSWLLQLLWILSSSTSQDPLFQPHAERFTAKELGADEFLDIWPYTSHRNVSFSRANDNLIATSGRPGNCLKVGHLNFLLPISNGHSSRKVCHAKSSQALVTCQQPVVGGLSWHLRYELWIFITNFLAQHLLSRLPYLAVGGDREVALYKISFWRNQWTLTF